MVVGRRMVMPLQSSIRAQVEIAAWAEPMCMAFWHHQQKHIHPGIIPMPPEIFKSGHGAVLPWQIGIDDINRVVAEMRQSLLHAAAGFERIMLARYGDFEVFAFRQM